MFADIAWRDSSGNLQAVGPRAHESPGKQILHVYTDRGEKKICWLDKEIINKICNTDKVGGNSRRVKMANEPCGSIFV